MLAAALTPCGTSTGSVRQAPPERATGGWRLAPEYLPLFAPRAHRAAYRAYVSALPLDEALRQLEAAGPEGPPLAARAAAQPVLPFDAFGQSGEYTRSKLARLYGSRRVRTARGARVESGRVVETWMAAAPFPSPDLERLESGTLLLVLHAPEKGAQ